MKTKTAIILIAAGVALSFAFTAIVTPKAVKAAIATLIRDQDNAARHPFTTSCFNFVVSTSRVSCLTPNIPLGEEVVVETVGFSIVADPSNTQVITSVATAVSGIAQFYPYSIVDNGVGQPGNSIFTATQPVRLYADPANAIICQAQTKLNNPTFGISFSCIISGYSVSLP